VGCESRHRLFSLGLCRFGRSALTRNHRHFGRIVVTWASLFSLAAGMALMFTCCTRITSQAAPDTNGDPDHSSAPVRAERRDFSRTVRLNGTVEAVQSYNVVAPRLAGQAATPMVITKLINNGMQVREGDVLVEFDRQTQVKNVLDRQAEYEDLEQQIKRKQADQAVARARDDTDLKGAEVDVQSARVDMRANDLIALTQAEINKQNLEEAEARLKLLRDTLGLKREAEAADLRILEIQRDRARKAMEYAQNNIERMTIKSPLNGMVVLTPVYRSSRYVDPQEGDEVRPGSAILKVVNPSAMQVRARVNQVDLSYLQPGQYAEVRLDAYPDLAFPATLDRVSAVGIASYSSKQIRYFTAYVRIKGSNPKLLPDLTAAVDIRIQTLDKVLVLPREAIINQSGQTCVMVLQNEKREMRAVTISLMSDLEAVIASGIDEGTVVSRNPRLGGIPSMQPAK
jgi:HlyD family secretion protein